MLCLNLQGKKNFFSSLINTVNDLKKEVSTIRKKRVTRFKEQDSSIIDLPDNTENTEIPNLDNNPEIKNEILEPAPISSNSNQIHTFNFGEVEYNPNLELQMNKRVINNINSIYLH